MGCGGSKDESIERQLTRAPTNKGNPNTKTSLAKLEKRFKGKRDLNEMTIEFGYFAHTATAVNLLMNQPTLLLFPWEYQRAMGVVKARNPMKTRYTFVSHQWETPGHPFPDLRQLTKHLLAIETEWFWLDWYCVPQWSRNADPYPIDPIAVTIFLNTMRSFHKLCAFSETALVILKRGKGLKMRGFDPKGWHVDNELREYSKGADEQVAAAKIAVKHESDKMAVIATEIAEVGLDLEYAVRAWCALERCYLPSAPHRDTRILKLTPLLRRLEEVAMANAKAVRKATGKKEADHGGSHFGDDEDTTTPLAILINAIERLKGILALCQASDESRALYMNAYSYHYLKKCVLTITNAADYEFLDTLMVTDTGLGAYGSLYIASVAGDSKVVLDALAKLGDKRPDKLVEPRVYWPIGEDPPSLTLDAIMGIKESKDGKGASQANEGVMNESFQGLRLARITTLDLEHKKAIVEVSDAGLLGANPHLTEFDVRWQGSRKNITALVVKVKHHRLWTLEDRVNHAKMLRGNRTNTTLQNVGFG